MMKPEPQPSWSLEELSDKVGAELARRGLLAAQSDPRVSAAPDARTVRYYTTLGLVDRPAIVGRQARYAPRHALQLLAVKALQIAGLPLAQIQERLYGRSEAELSHLVDALTAQASERTQIDRAPQPLVVREFALAPGLRLQVEEGFAADDVDALCERLRQALLTVNGTHGAGRARKAQ